MKQLKWGLGAGLATLALTPALAQQPTTDGHSLVLKSRLVQFDVDVDRSTTSGDFNQSALGLQLDYESAFLADKVGLGVSAYQVQKLGEAMNVKNEMLPNSATGGVKNSWSQIGQAFIKFKHDDLLQAKIGRQFHNSLLLKSTTSRAVPDTYSGLSAEIKPLAGLKLYAASYDSWLPRNGDKFQKFRTESAVTVPGGVAGDISRVDIYGAQYKVGAWQFDAESLTSRNYLQKYGATAAYTMTLANKSSLTLSAGASTTADAGDLFRCGAEKEVDFVSPQTATSRCNNNGKGVFAAAQWRMGNVTLGGAVAKFSGLWIEDNFAVNNSGKGSIIQDHGSNFFPTGATSGNDMTNDGELASMVSLGYDFKDVAPGLRATFRYKKGTGARNNAVANLGSGSEREKEYDVQYALPFLKGLSVRYNYLQYSASQTGVLRAISEGGSKKYREDHRTYVDYTYRFF